MPDDKRRFALRENGEETSVFKGNAPRQAALKAARRLDPEESKEEAVENSERITLREHGTKKVHIYDAWAWESDSPDDTPEWLEGTITRGNVNKVGVEEAPIPEERLRGSTSKSPIEETVDFDKEIEVTKEKCGRCGHSLKKSITVAVREVLEPRMVRYTRNHYKCDNCQNEPIAKQSNCPSLGGFGVNVLAQAVLFHFEHRLPYRKTAELFEQLYNFEMDGATVLHLCEYMKTVSRREYEEIWEDICSSDVIYVDETSHYVNGENKWLWAFTTKEQTLYTLRETRGSEVLEKILGDDFSGIIVCDGHTAYPAFHSRLQRCWGHLLRGTDQLSDDDDEAWGIYNDLFDIYEGLQEFLETDPSLLQRLVVARDARRELRRLTATNVESEDAIEVLTMLENGLGHWLTFVEYPDVEPTNNRVETVLREPIKIRRIIGQLQNEKGMRLHETFLSLLRTWKQQDKNPYSELQRLARKV
jgi:transposase